MRQAARLIVKLNIYSHRFVRATQPVSRVSFQAKYFDAILNELIRHGSELGRKLELLDLP